MPVGKITVLELKREGRQEALARGDEAGIELDRLAREEFEARSLPITW